jgi:hypothetical protein
MASNGMNITQIDSASCLIECAHTVQDAWSVAPQPQLRDIFQLCNSGRPLAAGASQETEHTQKMD